MRISTIQAFNNGVQGLQRNYANVTRTQEQISTGNRILTPADDPVASVRLLQLEQQQNVLSQYGSNLTAAKNSLTQEEVTLNSVNTILQRVRELTVQAGNGALSQTDRRSIAAELGTREEELLGLMNTRNARGEYLFAGLQGKTQPFVRQADGTYSYQGDEGQRKLQVASSLELPISDNGKKTFENVINAGRLSLNDSSVPPAPLPTGPVSGLLVDDEVSFASFPANGFQLDFDAVDPMNYTLRPVTTPGIPGAPPAPDTPAVLGTAISGRLKQGEDTLVHYQGVAFYVNGTPAAGASFTITGPDASPATPPPNKVGILSTIASLRNALENATDSPAGSRETRDAVALALTNLDHGMATVDGVRGEIGARLNVVESTQIDNEDVSLVNKAVQTDLRELDYPEALSRLTFQSIVLEAAQQSYVKISGLNLFDKLR
ncbi:flagellar hook-associated protein FlgL [Pseudomonas benzenivorans]|uniref:Flagellar hook-associated protein FlgL n=1 Tax=Pseudomonas benzenivorans TaxID=556533 RepID=A0ABY5H793_9PSED|nr:flagellar hook-associated protein FlgL [Pseudomonas benzenivorans]UTW07294.1 flagellar hook-associated protein FlgL [Pseudomonas benzenivorans]